MTSDAGHGLAQKAIEHLKQTAISSTSSTRLRASNYWLRDPALIQKSEIVVFENETKRYTLVPSQNLLVHENNGDPGYDLFTITWNPGSNPNETTPIFKYVQDGGDDSLVPRVADPDVSQSRLFSMKSKASESSLPCIFVALGWLREKDLALAGPMSEAGMQTTYYVVLLNLSTNPVSVWLMFDYHIEDEDGDCFRWTNRLEDYHNHVCSREFQKGRRLPKREDGFPVPTGDGTRFRNFLDQYSNLKRPLLLPRDADHAFDHPSERGAEFVPQGDSLSHKWRRSCSMLTMVQSTDATSETRRQASARDRLSTMAQTTTSPLTSLAKTIRATLVYHVTTWYF